MADKECGCYDGPYMEDSTIMVSVRCPEHNHKPAKPGHGLMERDKKGRVKAVSPRDVHSAQAISLAKTRKANAARGRKMGIGRIDS